MTATRRAKHLDIACGLLAAVTSLAGWAGSSRDDAVVQANAAVDPIKRVGTEKAVAECNADKCGKTGGMTVRIVDEKGIVLASSIDACARLISNLRGTVQELILGVDHVQGLMGSTAAASVVPGSHCGANGTESRSWRLPESGLVRGKLGPWASW